MRLRPLFALAAAALALVAASAEPAAACSCAAGDPRAMLAGADAAFIGTLVERRDERSGPIFSSGDPVTLVFRVERVVKGSLGATVEVRTAASGASCGIEVAIGRTIGLFLDRQNERWTSSLCAQIEPRRLLEAAAPLPRPLAGRATLLVGGRFGGARTLALDARGRTAAYGSGRGETVAVSVCPGSRRVTEAARHDARLLLAVRDLRTFRIVRERRLAAWQAPGALLCRDPLGRDVVLFGYGADGTAEGARLVRVSGRLVRTLWRGAALHAGLSRSHAFLSAGRRGDRLVRIDLRSGRAAALGRLPPRTGPLVPSPQGARLAAVSFSEPSGRGAPPSRAVLVRLAPPLSVRTAPLGQSNVSGAMIWLDHRRVAFFPDGGLGDVRVYDGSLAVLRRWGGWSARAAVRVGPRAYGVGWPDQVVSAALPAGPARPLSRLPSPVVHVVAGLPAGPRVRPVGPPPEPAPATAFSAAPPPSSDGVPLLRVSAAGLALLLTAALVVAARRRRAARADRVA